MNGRVRLLVTFVRERTGGVRVRLTALVTVLLAAALAIAAAIMLFLVHASLTDSADAATGSRALAVASVVQVETVAGIDADALAATTGIDVVQVIDSRGRLVAGTHGVRGIAHVLPMSAGTRRTVDGVTYGADPTEYRASVVGVATSSGAVTIVVGAAEGPIDSVVTTVAVLLALVFPIILVLLAGSAFYVSGRTLRPVARIRAQVSTITSTDLRKRVSVPRTHDEIAGLARTMNQMLARLNEAREQQLRFVGDASHELRSPLMTIVGILDIARTTGEPIDESTITGMLFPEAQRLQQLVDDLLLLAKSDERGTPLRVSDVDVDDIVGEQVRRLEQLSTVGVAARIAAMRVRGDRAKLDRALRNVVDNAVRYARSRVEVSMAVDSARQVGAVVVSDDGPGIPAEDRERVLDRFVRLDSHRERGSGGAGLGLAIVDEIVRAHHGGVRIGSSQLGGAEVVITLPLA
ncbi:HAMP domain-containing histidine kinase [Gordonia sp. TBRC 11910]|uniref:histidine kinase n=1 Tax=Gordonia asplenii TaxID=2725283 RepID=A0A848L4X3_9ACTN|nr:HAMP domain-containing sensor histidine kinase [Gordonia asplenii]NMO03653.1 HAMP domain-containing histidine kinase [Gordonia asplenii]